MDCTRQSGTSSDAFKYYLRAQRPSGQTHTSVNIGVALELSDVIALRGKTLTFSCKLRKGANYSPTSDAIQMSCGSNNDAADQDKSQNYVDGIASVTKTLTSSWQTFSVSHTVEADAVALIVRLKATTAGTAGAADYFDLAQAKMELGSQTEFEPKGYGEELALCQRYYQKSYDVGSAPGSVDNSNFVSMIQMANSATSTANNGTRLRFVQRLRAAPSVTVYAPDGTSGNLNYSRHSTAASEVAATVSAIGSTGVLVYTTSASGMTAGDAIEVLFHYTADAEL